MQPTDDRPLTKELDRLGHPSGKAKAPDYHLNAGEQKPS